MFVKRLHWLHLLSQDSEMGVLFGLNQGGFLDLGFKVDDDGGFRIFWWTGRVGFSSILFNLCNVFVNKGVIIILKVIRGA